MDSARRLALQRPLVSIDTETTGARPFNDRIVEIALVRLYPDGRRESYERRVNPEMRIPIEATAVHGITNADVESCPPFRRIAGEIVEFIGDADLCGFNIHGFDLPLLLAEFSRCGQTFQMDDRRVIDAQVIFHKKEPRDLTAAVSYYLGRDHQGAHGAAADAVATLDVLLAQVDRYGDMEPSVPALAAASTRRADRYVDPDRKLEWRDGEACLTFGKHSGRKLADVMAADPEYVDWILNRDFPAPLKAIIEEARAGRFPRPAKEEES